MNRNLIWFVFMITSPALADGAFDIILILFTGYYFISLAFAAWGIIYSFAVRPGLARIMSIILSVVGAPLGYWIGWELAEYRMAHITLGGAVGWYAPIAIFWSATLGRLPSYVAARYWPVGVCASTSSGDVIEKTCP